MIIWRSKIKNTRGRSMFTHTLDKMGGLRKGEHRFEDIDFNAKRNLLILNCGEEELARYSLSGGRITEVTVVPCLDAEVISYEMKRKLIDLIGTRVSFCKRPKFLKEA